MSAKETNHAIIDPDEEAFANAMQISSSFIIPIVFNAVIELGLLDIIYKNKEITPSELTSHLPVKNKDAAAMLDSMLRLLTTHSVLKSRLSGTKDRHGEAERLYELAPSGELFVQDVNGGRPYTLTSYFLLTQNPKPTDIGYHLKDAILEGGGSAFERAFGISLYKLNDVDPVSGKKFDTAMSDQTSIIMTKVLETYKGFLGIKSLVDIGGGIGTNLHLIASKYPSIKFINFDLPHVIADAPPHPEIEHVAGDMFVEIPKSEAILLKWVLHNWDDEHCVKLLKICYKALPEHGKVILIELILAAVPTTSTTDKYISQMDNNMLVFFGTKERTITQYEALSKAAGFTNIQVKNLAYGNSVVEIYK